MDTIKTNIARKPFLERIANFDLEKYYTAKIRIVCHLLMWLIFTFLLQINLLFEATLPLNNTFAFAARSLICNATVFYLFFYVLLPLTLFKNRVISAFFFFLICIIIWIILNHYCLVFIGKHFIVEAPYYKQGIDSNMHENFARLVSPRNILAGLVPVFYSISPFFFTKIVFDIYHFYFKMFKLERKAINLEVEKLILEKKFLKAQLNPHFLFNTLNNLYGLALRRDHETPKVITQLSEMMRYSLYESDAEKVPVAKELQYLKNYVMLEKMRYKNNTDIVCNINESQIDNLTIAPLLTFIFVENSFKYGLKSKKEGFLKINISIVEKKFFFTIMNDKDEKNKQQEFGGIGQVNVRKRLQLLYPGKHELKIEDRGKTFFVEMTINLE
ncbi:MAG TPA: sensor histidine kinase [Hanamia sp.]|nr:sensor histidine kinase [Hanamia sp.]